MELGDHALRIFGTGQVIMHPSKFYFRLKIIMSTTKKSYGYDKILWVHDNLVRYKLFEYIYILKFSMKMHFYIVFTLSTWFITKFRSRNSSYWTAFYIFRRVIHMFITSVHKWVSTCTWCITGRWLLRWSHPPLLNIWE